MRAMHGCVQAGNRLAQRVWLSAAAHYSMRAELGGGSTDVLAARVVRRCTSAQRGASTGGPADLSSAALASPVTLAEFNAVREHCALPTLDALAFHKVCDRFLCAPKLCANPAHNLTRSPAHL